MADRLTPKRLGNDSLVARLYAAIPRRVRRRVLTYAGASLMLVASSSHALAVCAGDCNGSDTVTIDELIMGVNISLGTQPVSACPAVDSNSSNSVTINELVAAVSSSLKGCSGSLPSSAQATIRVLNRSGVAATVTVHGMFAPQSSVNGAGFASDYTVAGVTIPAVCAGTPLSCNCGVGNSCKCDTPSFPGVPRCEVPVTNLAPGTWLHDISAPATGQKQFRQSLLVSDPVKANVIESNQAYDWTVFATVLVVTSSADTGAGSLRNRIGVANDVVTPRPALIRFDHSLVAFPNGEVKINLGGNLTVIANDAVIDGTNAMGDPSPVQAFTARKYKTMLNFTGAAKLSVQAPRVQFLGLKIARTLEPDGMTVDQDLNGIGFMSNSLGGSVRTCLIDGGAAARTNADCPDHNAADGKDCIDAEGSGAGSFAGAVVVENSELRHCYDRAAKSQTAHLILRDNWIHHNLRGGVFAQSPTGHLMTERNLIEQNGLNCPNAVICSGGSSDGQPCAPASGCPGGSEHDGCPGGACVANPAFSGAISACGGTIVRTSASQMTAESAASAGTAVELISDGDVQRNGALHAIFLRQNATGSISNNFLCGMTTFGMEITSNTGSTPIGILGTASVFNGHGARFQAGGATAGNVNFGQGASFGKNAFAQNPLGNFFVESGSFSARLTENNQWEHCGNGASCDLTAIDNNDVTGNADFTPAQPHRNPGSLTITTVSPTKVAARGAIVHITGAGFNAIEGYNSYAAGTNGCPAGGGTCAAATNCATLNQGNTCNPVKGTCVEFLDPATLQWKPADAILGITPTHLVITSPIACSGQTRIRIKRRNATGATGGVDVFEPSISAPNFCRN